MGRKLGASPFVVGELVPTPHLSSFHEILARPARFGLNVQTKMAVGGVDVVNWHINLRVLPRLCAEGVEQFITQYRVVKETSVRGYKFFLEGYVHDVEGTVLQLSLSTQY